MNKFLSGNIFSFLLGINLDAELLGYGNSMFTFSRNCHIVSKATAPYCIPADHLGGFWFLHVLANTWYGHLFTSPVDFI